MGFKEWIIPQDKVFYSLIEREAQLVLEGAKAFHDFMNNNSDIEKAREEIKKIESKGDEVVHDVFHRLNRTFITPIDHEDISKLISLYDDVLDHIWSTINKMYLFRIKKITKPMKEFAEIILQSVQEINHALKYMRKMDQKEMERKFIEIHRLENKGDELLNNAYAKLFKQKDPIKIIVLKEIYEFLEEITDECEDVCLAIQNIVIKNA